VPRATRKLTDDGKTQGQTIKLNDSDETIFFLDNGRRPLEGKRNS